MMYTEPTKRYDVEATLSGQAQGLPVEPCVGVEISSAEAVILGLGTRWWWCREVVWWCWEVALECEDERSSGTMNYRQAQPQVRSDAFHRTDVRTR
jgi:hypothetical protein